jgi:hypothetical protein
VKLFYPYKLLKPINSQPRGGYKLFSEVSSREELFNACDTLQFEMTNDVLALDIETVGCLSHDLNSTVIGCGLSCKNGTIYIDFRGSYKDCWVDLCTCLIDTQLPLIMHNALFTYDWDGCCIIWI